MRYLVALLVAYAAVAVAYAAHLLEAVDPFFTVIGVLAGTFFLVYVFMRIVRVDIALISVGGSLIMFMVLLRVLESVLGTMAPAVFTLAAICITAAIFARFAPKEFLADLRKLKIKSRAAYMDDLDGDWKKPFKKNK